MEGEKGRREEGVGERRGARTGEEELLLVSH